MKKFIAILSLAVLFTATACSDDYLTTDPTDRVSGTKIFSDSESAMAAVNGIYRLMYTGGWGSGWESENGGLPAYILVFDLLAEDHIMDGSGSGWFYYDYAMDTWGDYTSKAGHQYNIWNFFYTLISNANYILANVDENGTPHLEGDQDYANYALGQAYAIRAFCYMYLVQCYQQNDPAKPGVPLYTEPTVAGSMGKGRGTVQDVYDQANKDIDMAIELLEKSSIEQLHPSHISKYVAYGLKARHALVQHDYATAQTFAEKAMAGAQIASFSDIEHVNSVAAKNVLWGLAIQTDQAIGVWEVYNHMDSDCKSTYSKARHLISNWLYAQIPETDARKAWWTAPLDESEWGTAGTENGSKRSWCQKKLVYINAANSTGDHILMREEEMYLIAAEAACHQGNYAKAREYVKAVGEARDTNYDARLAKFSDSKSYNPNTVGTLSTLMDEILFQRRVELWGEVPRMHDLQRLGLGYNRNWEGTNHKATLTKKNTNPASPAFILWIPQAEFDGNEALDAIKDQNPDQNS
ncbi:MAG: RagB/SusD family nutrient uptake outer membrane protein [Bacteroidales bacterium]|nr:RagB/SusD family nutrient uptake outer membrane protein [Bacteroidales bacterium]